MHFTHLEQNLWVLGALGFWVLVYILMIRRGLKDKSYGMPMVALCLNVAWETYYSFFSVEQMANRVVNGMYLATDLGVLWTCWRYGPEDFPSRLLRKYFRFFIVAALVCGFILIRQFALSFHDNYGAFSASFTTLLLSVLLVGMLLRRDSVRGQSLYIGLFILLGNTCGAVENLIARQTIDPELSLAWANTAYGLIILTNILYLLLYINIARRDDVSLWGRV